MSTNAYGQQDPYPQYPDPYAQPSANPYASGGSSSWQQPTFNDTNQGAVVPYGGQPYGGQQYGGQQYGYQGAQSAWQAAGGPAGPVRPGMGQMDPASEMSQASMAHWLSIFAGIWVPIIMMATSGEKSPFVRKHAREELNLQLTYLVATVVNVLLMFVIIGFFTALACGIYVIVQEIQAAQAASRGQDYRIPMTIRFLS